MIVQDTKEFFVNGHRCEVQCEGRDRYTGWIDGEKITSGHNTSNIRETLINDAKYRAEVEPEFWRVCRAVYNFIESQSDENGDHLWVYNGVVTSQVTPLDDVGQTYRALLKLESDGVIEEGQICMDLNVEEMWRATGKDLSE